jgi:hypothetical protein
MSLKGVVAIVADGNSGIGMESAVALATAGPTSLTDCKITPIATAPMASAPYAAAPSPSAKFASVERARAYRSSAIKQSDLHLFHDFSCDSVPRWESNPRPAD